MIKSVSDTQGISPTRFLKFLLERMEERDCFVAFSDMDMIRKTNGRFISARYAEAKEPKGDLICWGDNFRDSLVSVSALSNIASQGVRINNSELAGIEAYSYVFGQKNICIQLVFSSEKMDLISRLPLDGRRTDTGLKVYSGTIAKQIKRNGFVSNGFYDFSREIVRFTPRSNDLRAPKFYERIKV